MTGFDVQVGGSAGTVVQGGLIVSDGTGNVAQVATCGGVVGSNGITTESCSTPVGITVRPGSTMCTNALRATVRGFIANDR